MDEKDGVVDSSVEEKNSSYEKSRPFSKVFLIFVVLGVVVVGGFAVLQSGSDWTLSERNSFINGSVYTCLDYFARSYNLPPVAMDTFCSCFGNYLADHLTKTQASLMSSGSSSVEISNVLVNATNTCLPVKS